MPGIETLDLEALKPDWELMARTHVVITLDAFTWMCVLGALQLAFRHPAYTGPSSDIVRNVAANIESEISLNERIAILLGMGWDPQFDVEPEAPSKP